MRCVISGINGVVGNNIAESLSVFYDWEVFGISRTGSKKFKSFNIDISEVFDVNSVVKEIGYIDIFIHCAANINENFGQTSLIETNVVGALRSYDLANQLGSRKFVNISGSTVYGEILNTPITESHPCNPKCMYTLSKLYSEKALELESLRGGGNSLPKVISLRIPSPIGQSMPERSIFPIMLRKALDNDPIDVFGNKNRLQNYLDLRDLSVAIAKIANKSNELSTVYNIAASKSYSNIELASLIKEAVGSDSEIIDQSFDPGKEQALKDKWIISCDKAIRDFSYSSSYNLKDTIDWVLSGRQK